MSERGGFSIQTVALESDEGRSEDLSLRIDSGELGCEMREVAYSAGRIAILGDCFIDDTTLRQAAERGVSKSDSLTELTGLPGNYVPIAEDSEAGTIIIDKSLSSHQPVYYQSSGRGVLVGSDASHIVDSSKFAVNNRFIVAHLTMVGPGAVTLMGKESCYQNVLEMQNGQRMTVERASGNIAITDSSVSEGQLSFQEAANELREKLIEAIQTRVESGLEVGSDFSGGIDSTTLAFLATKLGNNNLPVFFSGNSLFKEGDLDYVYQFLKLDQRLDFHQTDTKSAVNPFSLEGLLGAYKGGTLGETLTLNGLRFIETHFKPVVEAGVQLQLTGHGGDEVLQVAPSYLSDCLQAGQLARFISEGMSLARLQNASSLSFYLKLAQLTQPVRALQRGARAFLQPDISNLPSTAADLLALWQPARSGVSWLTDNARQEFAEFMLSKSDEVECLDRRHIGDHLAAEAAIAASKGYGALRRAILQAGIPVVIQAPLLDTNVVRAIYGASAATRGNPHDPKGMLAQALQDIVPGTIFERHTKGFYDQALSRSFYNSLPALRALMNDSYLAELGIIEPNRVLTMLNNLEGASTSDIWALERVIQTEVWLHGIDTSHNRHASTVQREARVVIMGKASGPVKPDTSQYELPEHMYAVQSESGTVVCFDRKTDSYYVLDAVQSSILSLLVEGETPEGVAQRLTQTYPSADAEVIKADVERTLSDFITKRIVDGHEADKSIGRIQRREPDLVLAEFSTSRKFSHQGEASRKDRLLATGILIGMAALRKSVTVNRKLQLLEFLQKHSKRSANYSEAQKSLHAAQRSVHLGRVACREGAYTAALIEGLKRRRVDYHQGVSFGPLAFHAWIAAEGRPVLGHLDGQVVGSFYSFFGDE